MKQLLILLICTIALFSDEVHSEGAASGFQLLSRPAGVSAVGRGYTGVASQGTFARYYNPAMYSSIDKHHISIELMRRMSISDLQATQFELGFSVNRLFFAFEAANQTVGNIYITDDLPGGFPDDAAATAWQFSEFSLNIGMRSDEFLSWGVTFGTAFDRFDGEVAYALIFGAGITYDLFDHKLKLGASAINWGLTTPMWGEGDETFGHGEALPSSIRLGAAYTQYIGQVRLMGSADMVYTHVFESRDSIESDFGNRIAVPLGIEVSPIDWATIRVGKRINGGSDIINFGLGFNNDWIAADLSFVIHSYGGVSEVEWMTGVTLTLGNSKAKEQQKIIVDEPAIVTPLDSTTAEDSVVVKDQLVLIVDSTKTSTVNDSVHNDSLLTDLGSVDSLATDAVDSSLADSTKGAEVSESKADLSSAKSEDVAVENEAVENIDESPTPQSEALQTPVELEDKATNDLPEASKAKANIPQQNIDEELDLIE